MCRRNSSLSRESPTPARRQWTIALVANLARLHGLKGAILQFEDNPERNRRDLIRYAKAWHNQAFNPIKEDPVAWVDRMFKTISPNEGLDDERDFDLDWLKGAIEEAAGAPRLPLGVDRSLE